MPEPPEALNLKPFRGLSETAGVITEAAGHASTASNAGTGLMN